MDVQFKCFVSGVFAGVLRWTRIAGLAPLRFVRNKDGWRISSSFCWSMYGYVMVTMLLLLTAASFVIDWQSDQLRNLRAWSNTLYSVWVVQMSLTMTAAGLAVFTAPTQMRFMAALLNRVQKINDELNIDYWPKSLGRKMSGMIIALLVGCVALSTTEVIWKIAHYWDNHMSIQRCVSGARLFYFVCYCIQQFRNVQFIVTVFYVKYSFKVVNDNLKSILQDLEQLNADVVRKITKLNNYIDPFYGVDKQDTGSCVSKFRKQPGIVRRLTLLYASLCDVVQAVNRAHGPMVLLLVISNMLHILCAAYQFITYLTADITVLNMQGVFIMPSWFFFHIFCLVMTIEPCHLTHMETRQTRELVSCLISSTHTVLCNPLEMEMEYFYSHLVRNEVYYMPMNIFTISRGLLITILGSITTYTVVILHV